MLATRIFHGRLLSLIGKFGRSPCRKVRGNGARPVPATRKLELRWPGGILRDSLSHFGTGVAKVGLGWLVLPEGTVYPVFSERQNVVGLRGLTARNSGHESTLPPRQCRSSWRPPCTNRGHKFPVPSCQGERFQNGDELSASVVGALAKKTVPGLFFAMFLRSRHPLYGIGPVLPTGRGLPTGPNHQKVRLLGFRAVMWQSPLEGWKKFINKFNGDDCSQTWSATLKTALQEGLG